MLREAAAGRRSCCLPSFPSESFRLRTFDVRGPDFAALAAHLAAPRGALGACGGCGGCGQKANAGGARQVKTQDLVDLTEMAYKGAYSGVYPSAGGCDESIRLFLYRVKVVCRPPCIRHRRSQLALDLARPPCTRLLPRATVPPTSAPCMARTSSKKCRWSSMGNAFRN